jgi:hypothetical protein
MARIRSIKPGFTSDEELSTLDAGTHLLAAGLLCYADDEGYFNANPGLVKGAVIPLREPAKSIGEMLEDLVAVGYLQLGNGPDGKRYGRIVNFDKHQKVSHKVDSEIKKMPIRWEGSISLIEKAPEVSGEIPESSVSAPEPLRPELNRTELNGIEGEAKKLPPPGLHELSYAPRILQDLGLPETTRSVRIVAAAIKARARGEPSGYPAAVEYITARAMDDRDQGVEINGFWFEDGKYERKLSAKKSIYDAIDRPI